MILNTPVVYEKVINLIVIAKVIKIF
jgi:hypothetical protein